LQCFNIFFPTKAMQGTYPMGDALVLHVAKVECFFRRCAQLRMRTIFRYCLWQFSKLLTRS
jgi:hypothetical protein